MVSLTHQTIIHIYIYNIWYILCIYKFHKVVIKIKCDKHMKMLYANHKVCLLQSWKSFKRSNQDFHFRDPPNPQKSNMNYPGPHSYLEPNHGQTLGLQATEQGHLPLPSTNYLASDTTFSCFFFYLTGYSFDLNLPTSEYPGLDCQISSALSIHISQVITGIPQLYIR